MRRILLIYLFILTLSEVMAQATPDTEFNSLLRKFNGGWIAGDATFSIALPENKTLWLFGDSFIGTVNPDSSIVTGSHFIRNCAVLQEGDSMRALFNGSFAAPVDFLLSSNPNSSWLWPEHGLVENDTLKIFFSEFITWPGVSGFNFKYISAQLAFFTYPEIQFLDMVQIPYYNQNNVCYGNCVMVENGYTYIYGRKETDTVHHVSYPHLARAPAGNLQAPWQFFNGTSWVNDPAASFKIGNVAVSQQYGVFKQNNLYVLISQEIWLSSKIYSYTFTTPQGPLNNKQLLYQTPILYPTSFTYNAFPHIQFTENNELLISYNTNGDFWSIFSNVELYRPLFIRVPLSMIDTSFATGMIPLIPRKGNRSLELFQNSPNPVDSFTRVEFKVNEKQYVSLQINDLKGNKVHSYVNSILDPGIYTIDMDLQSLHDGIYCYGTGRQYLKLLKN
jgi:hypothetical protein